jgi:hypothetical protein
MKKIIKKTKKTKKIKKVIPQALEPGEVIAFKEQISLLDVDFGRGDLNLMRDKLIEVINKLNGN